MKRYLLAILSGVLVMGAASGQTFAQDEKETRSFAPVETFSCTYNDGKGPADLDKAIAFWNKYMDDQGVEDYFALTVTPHFFGPNNGSFDVGWIGAWPDGEAMGAGFDNWFATGTEAAAGMYEVLSCDSHSNFASMRIKTPPGDAPPQNPVLVFSDCNAVDDGAWDPAFEALDAWADYQTEAGYQNGTWALFPAYGGGGDVADFKLVESYPNYTALGKAYDLYGNGEGYVKHGELMGGVLDCDVSRVYNSNVVRRMSRED